MSAFSLVDHEQLVELCRDLHLLSCAIAPAIDEADRLDRVAAAASCLSEAPDAWLQAALEQLQQEAA